MKFYDIEIVINGNQEIEITQSNYAQDRTDILLLTKDMLLPVIHELEALNKKLNEIEEE